MACWNNLLEVWELPLDDAAHQEGVAELELQLVFRWRECDLNKLVCVGEEAEQLSVCAGRHNNARLRGRLCERRARNGDAVVICRGKRCLLAGESRKDPSENRSGLVARCSEHRAVECGT